MTEFSVFMPLQGITPGNSLFRVIFLKDYKTIWKIKIREMKKKKKNLIALWIKWTGTVKTKHKDFVGADPINLNLNLKLTNDGILTDQYNAISIDIFP